MVKIFLMKYLDEYTSLYLIKSGVPQGSVLDSILHLLYTGNLLTTAKIMNATFSDDIAILALHKDPAS